MRPAIIKTTRQDKQINSKSNNKHLHPKLNVFFENTLHDNEVKIVCSS